MRSLHFNGRSLRVAVIVNPIARPFVATGIEPEKAPDARWTKGKSIDGRGLFSFVAQAKPLGEKPRLGPPDPKEHAQAEQILAYSIQATPDGDD